LPNTRQEPMFNLRAVVQQTGIKPDTLRAWERRYGLPAPHRSSGGHRLYSQRDIDTIKWLMARQREGLSISRAVELWAQHEAGGQDPLLVATSALSPASPIATPRPAGGTVSQMLDQWIGACLAYDEHRAEHILNQAFALFAPETVVIELLQRGVSKIGDGWYDGTVSVQQEHFCSSLVMRRLETLVMATQAPTRSGRILAACPPEEDHVISLLLITYLLRRQGWDVVYLGANVPVEQLETTIETTSPQLVLLSAQLLRTAATLRSVAQLLQQQGVPLGYGGLIFNRLPAARQRIAGHFLGEEIEFAPQMIESLMTSPRPAPVTEDISNACLQALEHFEERQGLIDTLVQQTLGSGAFEYNHVSLANWELGLNINAALVMGDLTFLDANVDWVTSLLANHELPEDALSTYLHAYHQAAIEHLDEPARPITDWLARLLNRMESAE